MDKIKAFVSKLDIVQVVSSYVSLKKAGNNFKGLCPFHSEDSPSFVVSPEKRIFKCFGCNESGDALSFYMKINKMSFLDAVESLASKFGIHIDIKKNSKHEHLYNILNDTSSFYSKELEKNENCKKYYEGRGLKDVISYASLGYAPKAGLYNYLTKKGHKSEDILSLGLAFKKEDRFFDAFRDRAIFTIFNKQKRVIGFGARTLKDETPKYINSQDSKVFHKGSNLYGFFDLGYIKEKGYIVLVEGYTDVLACHKVGLKNVVASLGTSLTLKQAELIKGLVNNVIILYDSDKAGELATERSLLVLKKAGLNVKISRIEEKDPDTFLSSRSKGEFLKVLSSSKQDLRYLIDKYKKGDDLSSIEKFIGKIKPFFQNLKSSLDRELWLEKVSFELNVSKSAILERLKGEKAVEKTIKKREKISYFDRLELQTISLLKENPASLEILKELDSFKNSRLSLLTSGKIKENIDFVINGSHDISSTDNLNELSEEIFQAWRKRSLELISSSNKKELIGQYLARRKEMES